MAKPSPAKTAAKKGAVETGPKSAEVDEVDDIYKEQDPIDVSIAKRKAAGSQTTVVADKNAKGGKFFFNLRTKGELLTISEDAKKNNAKEEGRVD